MMEEIMALARTLGQVSEDQMPVLETLCRAAEQEMTGRLRDGVTPEDCGQAFALGCAWLALAGLTGGQAYGGMEFTAGSVTIREGGSGEERERSAALRLQAEMVLGPYLKDRHFVFRGVEG